MKPDLKFEKPLWQKGFGIVGGLDEVGRGCFAGPVVAGCVVFPRNITTKDFTGIRVDDSKKLTVKGREEADAWIKKHAYAWGIGEAGAAVINRLGIAKATKIAFRRAIGEANARPGRGRIEYVLIDAFFLPYTKGLRRKNQQAIVHGDEKSLTIAAASIIAKVYRDNLMSRLGNRSEYKKYRWDKNKGYGTHDHQNAIKKFGLTRYHRKQFVDTFLLRKKS